MSEENLRSKNAFGAEANLDAAIESGKVDAFDILFLKDAKGNPVVGWLDKNGEKQIVRDRNQVVASAELPSTGEENTLYVVGTELHIWDGEKFIPLSGAEGVTETVVDQKIATATDAAKAYTDKQIASAITVVEF